MHSNCQLPTGLWTHHTLAYLESSSEGAMHKLPAGTSQRDSKLVHDIIEQHHKVTSFAQSDSLYSAIVEAVRKADWIDATAGTLSKGMPRVHINKVTWSLFTVYLLMCWCRCKRNCQRTDSTRHWLALVPNFTETMSTRLSRNFQVFSDGKSNLVSSYATSNSKRTPAHSTVRSIQQSR